MKRMRTLRAFALSLALSLTLSPAGAFPAFADTAPSDGAASEAADASSETFSRTLRIRSVQGLELLAKRCSYDDFSRGLLVELDADLSLEGSDFLYIPVFEGTFRGNGHTVSDFRISGELSPAGFFGTLGTDAKVTGLRVEGSVEPAGKILTAGGIAGINRGFIEDCSFSGIVAASTETGGIAGENASTGTIRNCSAEGEISGLKMTGGIAGRNSGTIQGSYNQAYVNVRSVDPSLKLDELSLTSLDDLRRLRSSDTVNITSDTGGIAGYSEGSILSCYNFGTVGYQHTGYNAGGIAGRSCGFADGCQNSGKVYGRKDIGGIVGQAEPYILESVREDKQYIEREQDEVSRLHRTTNSVIDDIDSSSASMSGQAAALLADLSAASDAANRLSSQLTENTDSAFGEVNTAAEDAAEAADRLSRLSGEANDLQGDLSRATKNLKQAGSELKSISFTGNLAADFPAAASHLRAGAAYLDSAASGIHQVSSDLSVITSDTNDLMQWLDSLETLHFEQNGGELQSTSDELFGALERARGDADALNGTVTGAENTVSSGIRSINDSLMTMSTILFDAASDIKDAYESGPDPVVTDASDSDPGQITEGRVNGCVNYGSVNGDINVGGIAGAVSIEHESDPEDDFRDFDTALNRIYELRAVLSDCRNYGEITAKKDCCASICGKLELGSVTGCLAFGKVTSESGSYAGGIAGLSGSVIRGCFSRCEISAKKYAGGVIGSGAKEGITDSPSLVSDCIALVRIRDCERYVGAVSGSDMGEFRNNFFVSEELGGINRLSIRGEAEPLRYKELLLREGLPDEFRSFTLRYIADGAVLHAVSFSYGDIPDPEKAPEIPRKTGMYAFWDLDWEKPLYFDADVEAVYANHVTALASDVTRGSGKPVILLEGSFSDRDRAVIRQTEDYAAADSGNGEEWTLSVPDDGADTHMVRFLPPSAGAAMTVRQILPDGTVLEPETEMIGSYCRFPVQGREVLLRMEYEVRETNVLLFWLIVGAVAVLLLFVLTLRILKKRKRSTNAPKPGKKRVLLIVLLWAALLSVCASVCVLAYLYTFRRPYLQAGADAVRMLRNVYDSDSLSMNIRSDLRIGDREAGLDYRVDTSRLGDRPVYTVGLYGSEVWISDGKLYLENGRCFALSDMPGEYLSRASFLEELTGDWKLSIDSDEDSRTYILSGDPERLVVYLNALLPVFPEPYESGEMFAVSLRMNGQKLKHITLDTSGRLKDSQTPASAHVVITAGEQSAHRSEIPQAVAEAIRGGREPEADLRDLFRAAAAVLSQHKVPVEMRLDGSCGPLSIRRTLKVSLSPSEEFLLEDPETAAKVLKTALCMMTDGEISRSGSVYEIEMDEALMQQFFYDLLPRAEGMNLSLGSGTALLRLSEGRLASAELSVKGSVRIVDSEVPVYAKSTAVFP